MWFFYIWFRLTLGDQICNFTDDHFFERPPAFAIMSLGGNRKIFIDGSHLLRSICHKSCLGLYLSCAKIPNHATCVHTSGCSLPPHELWLKLFCWGLNIIFPTIFPQIVPQLSVCKNLETTSDIFIAPLDLRVCKIWCFYCFWLLCLLLFSFKEK